MSRALYSWLLISMLPAAAQAQVSLKYDPDFQTGQVYRAEVDVNTNQTLTLAGMPLETRNALFMVVRETIGEPTTDGGSTSRSEVETLQTDLTLPGGISFNFNSNNPERDLGGEVQEMIGGYFRAMSSAAWTMKTGPGGKVISAEYEGEPFADVNEMFQADSDPELLKKRTNTEIARYPTEPVNVGDTWSRTEEFQAGSGQVFTFEQKFELLGSEDRDGRLFDKVGIKTLSAILSVDNNPAVPAKVTESDLKVADSEGTLWYDRQAERFVEGHEKVHITGTLTVDVQGMSLPGEVDLTIETKSKSKLIDP